MYFFSGMRQNDNPFPTGDANERRVEIKAFEVTENSRRTSAWEILFRKEKG
jgi:hypothetical protein